MVEKGLYLYGEVLTVAVGWGAGRPRGHLVATGPFRFDDEFFRPQLAEVVGGLARRV